MADERKTPVTGPGEPKERSPRRSRTWLWMLLSLVVVGAFLTWLAVASEPTSVTVIEGDDDEGDEAVPLDSGVVAISRDSLAGSKPAFEGQRVQVTGVEASSPLGPRIFWGELGSATNQVPLLVRLDSGAAEGWTLQQGARYTLTGQILRMSDSVAMAWGELGEFTDEGAQSQAVFTDYFIQTSMIRRTRGDAGAGTAGGGAESPSTGGADGAGQGGQ